MSHNALWYELFWISGYLSQWFVSSLRTISGYLCQWCVPFLYTISGYLCQWCVPFLCTISGYLCQWCVHLSHFVHNFRLSLSVMCPVFENKFGLSLSMICPVFVHNFRLSEPISVSDLYRFCAQFQAISVSQRQTFTTLTSRDLSYATWRPDRCYLKSPNPRIYHQVYTYIHTGPLPPHRPSPLERLHVRPNQLINRYHLHELWMQSHT